MSRKFINLMVVCLCILLLSSLFGCSNKTERVSADKTFEQTIDEKLNNIVYPKDSKVNLSSNPYDYIKSAEADSDYKYIVSQGEKSLNYILEKFSSSNENGLREYIMAIACSEILKENPDSKNWGSGREWYDNYTKAKR